MKDFILPILKIIGPLSVALIVMAQALKISPGPVVAYFKDRPGTMLKSLLAVLVVVPVAGLAIILLLKPTPAVAIGLAILVACPPAPLMLKGATKLGQGNAAYMASLHLSLAALAFITVPIGLYLMSIPLGFEAEVDLASMAMILGKTIVLPVMLGIAVRAFFPHFADNAGPKADIAGTIGLGIVVVFVLVALYPTLLNMDPWSYLVIVVTSAATLGIGHLLGPSDASERTVLAIESGVRHPVLALTIAATNFSPQKALPVLVPSIMVFILMAVAYLVWRKKVDSASHSP